MMTKSCCKPFPVLISIACCLWGAIGCKSILSNGDIVDLCKSPGNKVSISSIYDRIELVLLENPGSDTLSAQSLTNMSVTEDRFYFKSGDSTIVSYFKNGTFTDTLNLGTGITDYSIYKDSILDVLSGKRILSYSLSDYSLKHRANLDTPVNLTRIARRKNMLYIPGYIDTQEYLCEYDYGTRYFAEVPKKSSCPDARKDAEQMNFFRYGDHLLSLYPFSERIWENAEFTFIFLDPAFKLNQDDYLEILFAQVADNKIFYSLLLNGKKNLLILDRKDKSASYMLDGGREQVFTEHRIGKKSLCINTTREGLSLPLGVIRDGVNYVCCTAADLPNYVTRDVLDGQSAEAMEVAIRKNCNVVLKYYLAAP